ncbi:hypothetical protein PIB30_055841 [Stylosanthes scabra]|uniref:Uncharacterized protein n=1 Tax=Stylosanthes scabra TaxID=79078 RepID=A0ABU6ZHY2_9FABA|nr:hypothetical protein [Stylosanthes scabra]
MSEKERGFGLKVQGPSRERAMTRGRVRGQMRAQKRALVGSCGHAVKRARARRPSSSWSESTKCKGTDAPPPSCGCTAVRARQERGADACASWPFIPRGNDTHFIVVLLVRFGALAEIGANRYDLGYDSELERTLLRRRREARRASQAKLEQQLNMAANNEDDLNMDNNRVTLG